MHKECQNIIIILSSRQTVLKTIYAHIRQGCASSQPLGLFSSLVCHAALRHFFRLPVLRWPAEEMAPTTCFKTGKHPAAALPDRNACPGHRRGSSVHTTAASRFLPHHHDCGVKFNGFSFTRWPRCGSCKPSRSGIPVVRRETFGKPSETPVSSSTTRMLQTDQKCAHSTKKCCCTRIRLWV